ncbi:hypothetical protein BOTBODRAFT_55468 [Botryobasidium botryosum FD-172 SS1]|uniref:Protein kinase domain-containing protein n=1 Tax=Botryobasidium botryosum (strain FD-172 SS1) TaxID=930990 RepID=A0A067MHV5_BOTB1|nr:hypothetical protein BOTBODRAFT_55468 [Botryobasidium botryosum FD-172 SS1]
MFTITPFTDAIRSRSACATYDDEPCYSAAKQYVGGSALRRMTYFQDCDDEEDVYEDEDAHGSDSSSSSFASSSLSRCQSFSSIEDAEDEDEEELLSQVDLSSVESISIKRVTSTSTARPLAQLLNLDQYRSDSWNHAIHTDVVEHGHDAFLVSKKLHDSASTIHNVRDCFEYARQTLEGLAFFHENFIARILMSADNIRADVGSPADADSDAESPVRYYYTDLEGAGCFERDGERWLDGLKSLDGENSESAEDVDPFSDDVSRFGALLESMFPSVSYLRPLISSMTCSEPTARPTAASALESLEQLWLSISPSHFERRVKVSPF